MITVGWLFKWDVRDGLVVYTTDQITLCVTLLIFLFTYGKMAHYYTKKSHYLDAQSDEIKGSLHDNLYFEHEFKNDSETSSFVYVVKQS